jgi:ribulose-bisphosphate carboxylase large chain
MDTAMKKDDKTTPSGSCDWIPPTGREVATGASCDWGGPAAASGDNRSAFYPFRPDFTWEGIIAERYKDEEGGWAAIARNVLIGNHGESARFDLRYFEIAPGGHSSLEKHGHEHVVVCIRGRGQVLLAGAVREMNFLDTAYIGPEDPHQLQNPFDEPFGFFCIVNHDRDRPRSVGDDEQQRLLFGPAARVIRG